MIAYPPCGRTFSSSIEEHELHITLTPYKISPRYSAMIAKWAITTTDGDVVDVGRLEPQVAPFTQADAHKLLETWVKIYDMDSSPKDNS